MAELPAAKPFVKRVLGKTAKTAARKAPKRGQLAEAWSQPGLDETYPRLKGALPYFDRNSLSQRFEQSADDTSGTMALLDFPDIGPTRHVDDELEAETDLLLEGGELLRDPPVAMGRIGDDGTLEMYLDPTSLRQLQLLRNASLRTGETMEQVPLRVDWEIPLDQMPENWTHNGTIRYVTDDGPMMERPLDSAEFPHLDLGLRRTTEQGSYWTRNRGSMRLWESSRVAANQARTREDVVDLIRTHTDPEAEDAYYFWYEFSRQNKMGNLEAGMTKLDSTDLTERHGAGITDISDATLEIREMLRSKFRISSANFPINGIEWNDIAEGNSEAIDRLMTGKLVEGFDFNFYKENSEVWQRFQKKRKILTTMDRELGGYPNFNAEDRQKWDNYFDSVTFSRMRENDPVRYQKMLDWVGDGVMTRRTLYGDDVSNPDDPIILFHGEQYSYFDEVAKGDFEEAGLPAPGQMSPSLHATAPEGGQHMGDLGQASEFAGSTFEYVPGTGQLIARPKQDWVNIAEAGDEILTGLEEEFFDQQTLDIVMEEVLKAVEEVGTITGSTMDELEFGRTDKRGLGEIGMDMLSELAERGVDRRTLSRTMPGPVVDAFFADVNKLYRSLAEQTGWMLYPQVTNIKRPFRLGDINNFGTQAVAREMLKDPNIASNKESRTALTKIIKKWHEGGVEERWESIRTALRTAGYDSLFYVNSVEGPGRPSIVILDEANVKSVYGSKGFDPRQRSALASILAAPGGLAAVEALRNNRAEDKNGI